MSQHPATETAPRRVLIVDDNRDAAESLALLLELDHHRVHVAFSVNQALQLACSEKPELVLLDISLPDIDGYEGARRLRAEPTLASTRIVALSGHGAPEDFRRARDAGFDSYLVKPITLETLQRLLASMPHAGNAAA